MRALCGVVLVYVVVLVRVRVLVLVLVAAFVLRYFMPLSLHCVVGESSQEFPFCTMRRGIHLVSVLRPINSPHSTLNHATLHEQAPKPSKGHVHRGLSVLPQPGDA